MQTVLTCRCCKCAADALMVAHSNHYVMSWLSQLHQPEYTGDNRCTPCTIANVTIAAIGSALLAQRSKWLGAGTFVAALGTIHLRGYLVPGTPTLTKRSLPDRVLRWFEHDQPTLTTAETGTTDETESIEPEQVLMSLASFSTPVQRAMGRCALPRRWSSRVATRTMWYERRARTVRHNCSKSNGMHLNRWPQTIIHRRQPTQTTETDPSVT